MVEQQPDPIIGPGSLSQQMACELVGPCIQLVMGQGGVIGIHGEPAALLHPVAQILEEVMETFTGSPPDRVLTVLPDQDAVSRHNPAKRVINKVAYPHIDDALESAVALGRSEMRSVGSGVTDGAAR
jgi:hypothetical protein